MKEPHWEEVLVEGVEELVVGISINSTLGKGRSERLEPKTSLIDLSSGIISFKMVALGATRKEVEALGASETSEEAEVLATGWKEKVVLGKLEEQGLQERSSGESVVETEVEEADIASWDTLTFKASKARGLRVRGRLVGTEDLTLGP